MSDRRSRPGSLVLAERLAARQARVAATLTRHARLVRQLRQAALRLAVTALFVYFSLASDVFLTVANFQNVGLAAAALAVVSFGQCFVVLTAGVDLSVGSTVALISVVSAMAMRDHGTALGVLAGLDGFIAS